MANCDLCGKKAPFWSSINEGDPIYCPDCWKNRKEGINALKIKEEENYNKRLEAEREKEGKFVLNDRILLMFGGIGLFLKYILDLICYIAHHAVT